MSSLATMPPPGGRSAPGGAVPPGGRTPPGDRPPRLSIGHRGRSGGLIPGRPGLVPRRGTKQVIKTTVRGPSQITKERRDDYKEKLQKYKKFRTDLQAAPVPSYQAPKGGMGDASYQAPTTGLGPKSPKNKAYRASQAKAHRAAIKQQKLGSPGHTPGYESQFAAYQQANLGQSAKDIRENQDIKGSGLPKGQPSYGVDPERGPGEDLAAYNERFAQATEAYSARPDVIQYKAEEAERHRKRQAGGTP